jgi:hypothetical protein
MADLFVNITTPNNHAYRQPTGLFIASEFVAASSGQTITSIDPAYVLSILFEHTYISQLTDAY